MQIFPLLVLYGLHLFVFCLMSFKKILLVEIKDLTYLCREYDAHVTLVHIHSTQVWSVEGGALVVIVSFWFVTFWMLTSSTDIFGKFRRLSHSLLRYSTAPTMTTCLSSWSWKLEALRGITKFLKPIRGLFGSANRQTTTWFFRRLGELDLSWKGNK